MAATMAPVQIPSSALTSTRLSHALDAHVLALDSIHQTFKSLEARLAALEQRRAASAPSPDWGAFLARMVERNRHVSGMALLYAEGSRSKRMPPVAAGMPLPDERSARACNSAFYAGEDPGYVDLGGHNFVVATREEVGDFLVVHLLPINGAEEVALSGAEGIADETPSGLARRVRCGSSFGPADALGGSLPAGMPLEDFRRRVRALVDSYLASQDADDAVANFRELMLEAGGSGDELIVSSVRTALERPSQHRVLISALLGRLHGAGVLDAPAFSRAFAKLVCTWEDLQVDDGPHAPAVLVGLLLSCIRAGCLDEAYLSRLPEGLLQAGLSARVDDGLASDTSAQAALARVIERLQIYKRNLEQEGLLGPPSCSSSRQASSTAQALRRLGMPEFHHEYVKRVFAASLDWPASRRNSVCITMLAGLLAEGVLAPEDVQWGVVRLLGSLEDLKLDCPRSDVIVADLLRDMLAEELLSGGFLRRLHTLHVGGAAGLEVLGPVLAARPSERSSDAGHTSAGFGAEDSHDLAGFLQNSRPSPTSTTRPPDDDSSGAYLCAMQRWVLAVVYEAGMDSSIAKRVCIGTAEYLTEEGQ
eukprot:TRINITY_DN37875_c0_g1_i1.p1 TRINITY_DN37875_c0_g1~~TRINITY_DN37875_c0_g1_i1.p1  ORF type:complete len:591 (-),score=124.99 TRINITY_DN37875_c0_g1_i1:61-1833(-)